MKGDTGSLDLDCGLCGALSNFYGLAYCNRLCCFGLQSKFCKQLPSGFLRWMRDSLDKQENGLVFAGRSWSSIIFPAIILMLL